MSKKQLTAKTVEEALVWILTNEHHFIDASRDVYTEKGRESFGDLIVGGHYARLIVKPKLRLAVAKYIQANTKPFDSRMYTVTKAGRAYLRRCRKQRSENETCEYRTNK